jgi:hypothetical protein
MSNSWPNPEKPGVPLNPEKNGWHWLKESGDDPAPYYWCPGFNNWHLRGGDDYGGGWQTPEFTSGYYSYVGPCLTPAKIDALVELSIKVGKQNAYERAAAIARGAPNNMPFEIERLVSACEWVAKEIKKEIMNNDR